MPEQGSWLRVRAAGMDLLLPTLDLREVVPLPVVSPIPGCSRGLQGVTIYQGEFLPVVRWEDLPGVRPSSGPPTILAVMRLRFGLPLEGVTGIIEVPADAWEPLADDDPAIAWAGAMCRLGLTSLHRVDPDRLLALLRRMKVER